MKKIVLYILVLVFATSCSEEKLESPLFTLKDNHSIGLDFSNDLSYTNDFNVYKYRNYYNGGGVAIGDINNDNLVDVYMISNQNDNQLFLNKGNWKFENITQSAGTGGTRSWSTGVTMIDINADGLLDIYVCNSGDVKGDNKENELFINNGDLTFTESAAEYNLNDKGYSTQASFFDYDKDGDLDAYILNNSFQAIGSFNLRVSERPKRDLLGGDKLMRNDNGKFVDVSEEAGIYGSVIGFGLGITVGDVNNDQWEDIFISNDFFERDYLYINQKDGTFTEELTEQIPSISGASMGADIADINNDGYNEIFVTEMLPSEYERLKTVTTFENWDKYQYNVKNGYYHQYTHNYLHLNNGNNTFSDISRLSGIEASDWSWGALFFDMDNDGQKDIYIANGIYKDLTNQDYLQYIANESVLASVIKDDGVDYKQLIDIIPSNKVANHAYHNQGNLNFVKFTSSGLLTEGFSNGAAYGDLDNDGDLDLIVNNVNMPSFIYENHSNENEDNNFVKVILKGNDQNTKAVGATIKATTENTTQLFENQPIRGFQSSMDNRINIGIGKATVVDLEVIWPDNTYSQISQVKAGSTIDLDIGDAKAQQTVSPNKSEKAIAQSSTTLPYVHKENRYVDFNQEGLIYHMMSTRGPCASVGDLDGDKQLDIFVPGSKGKESEVWTKDQNNSYLLHHSVEKSKGAEHIKCELFDADGDGDLDAYLASGGVEITKYSDVLFDQILLNDGTGKMVTTAQRLPNAQERISTGAIASSDIDSDGDIDLFVGERVKIGYYGAKCKGYILINDGKGNFEDMTSSIASELSNTNMITDAKFEDMDGDGDEDLIVAGEFMPITVYENKGGKFEKVDLGKTLNGWWNVIETLDIDNDGDLDIVAGNHGLNSRFKASDEFPVKMYYSDFDGNGYPEGVLAFTREDGKDYPYALRHNLTKRLPKLQKKFKDYEAYKTASIDKIFTPEELDATEISEVNELRSLVLINNGNFKFFKAVLPQEVQMSPMYAIANLDIDEDGDQDLIMGGNLYRVQPEMGRYDASYGHILRNDGKGNFTDVSRELGFLVKGEIRDIEVIDDVIYIFKNNEAVQTFEIKK